MIGYEPGQFDGSQELCRFECLIFFLLQTTVAGTSYPSHTLPMWCGACADGIDNHRYLQGNINPINGTREFILRGFFFS